jgi:hypothetical protein
MTAIFKSRWREKGESMKHLGLVHILLLLLGAGLFLGAATAELTASQNVPPTANVGENVMVTVMLTYSGSNAAEASITPGLSAGLETSFPGGQTELYPGISAPISYPIRAVQSGTYLVTSQVSYSEDGTWRNLRLESPFTATGQLQPGQQQPNQGQGVSVAWPQGITPLGTNPYGTNQSGINTGINTGMNPGINPYGTNQSGINTGINPGINPYGTNQSGTSPGMNPGEMPPSGGVTPEEMPNIAMPNSFQPEQSPTQESGPDGR